MGSDHAICPAILAVALGGESHVPHFIYWPTRELHLRSFKLPDAEATLKPLASRDPRAEFGTKNQQAGNNR